MTYAFKVYRYRITSLEKMKGLSKYKKETCLGYAAFFGDDSHILTLSPYGFMYLLLLQHVPHNDDDGDMCRIYVLSTYFLHVKQVVTELHLKHIEHSNLNFYISNTEIVTDCNEFEFISYVVFKPV